MLSFAIGFFPILAVQWLTQTVYKAFGQRPRRSDLFLLDQLDGISQAQELRLRDFGIDDAQNLASTEIPLLLINTPFPVQTVVDWVDQAILMVLLNNVNTLDNFRKAHVRTMTDFRDLWQPYVEKYRRLMLNREAADSDEAYLKESDVKSAKLREEQTDVANALNSNISLLDALYTSTNFDMNIHYLINYRKNVELLLPGWSSVRFNCYLIGAYQINVDDPVIEQNKLAQVWNSVKEYLQKNEEIRVAQEANNDDGSHGMIVEPNSIEARLGLVRLYQHLEKIAQKARENAQAEKDQQLAEEEMKKYRHLAEQEYGKACKQYDTVKTEFARVNNNGSKVPCGTPAGSSEAIQQ